MMAEGRILLYQVNANLHDHNSEFVLILAMIIPTRAFVLIMCRIQCLEI